jgi:hypothetical protein
MFVESLHQAKVCDLFGEFLGQVGRELHGLLADPGNGQDLVFSSISHMLCLIPASGPLFLFYSFSMAGLWSHQQREKGSPRSQINICHHSPDLSPMRSRYFRLKGV